MKVVHAVWEQRNLGRDAWEVTLEKKDMGDAAGVLAALHHPRYAGCYVCVKMPVGNLHVLHALEDDGFRFLETQLHLVEALEKSDVMKFAAKESNSRLEERVVPKTREEWGKVIEKITPGMFDTDRISMDPVFGEEIACKRYRNWCWDLFENPASVLKVASIDGMDVYFNIFVLEREPEIFYGVIGGTFPAGKDSGLGALSCAKASTAQGKYRTSVSTNNLPIIKIHQNLGRIVYGECYVLRKLYP